MFLRRVIQNLNIFIFGKTEARKIICMIICMKEEDCKECITLSTGRGVEACRIFENGEWVLEYIGRLITPQEFERLLKVDSNSSRSYLYAAGELHIDASEENGTLGRLINHSKRYANLKSYLVTVHGLRKLIFVAIRKIKPGDQLFYDYGDRPKILLESFGSIGKQYESKLLYVRGNNK